MNAIAAPDQMTEEQADKYKFAYALLVHSDPTRAAFEVTDDVSRAFQMAGNWPKDQFVIAAKEQMEEKIIQSLPSKGMAAFEAWQMFKSPNIMDSKVRHNYFTSFCDIMNYMGSDSKGINNTVNVQVNNGGNRPQNIPTIEDCMPDEVAADLYAQYRQGMIE